MNREKALCEKLRGSAALRENIYESFAVIRGHSRASQTE